MKDNQQEISNLKNSNSFIFEDNVCRVYISNMCCSRCLVEVQSIFSSLNLTPLHVKLGEVILPKKISEQKQEILNCKLVEKGFQIIVQERDQYAITIQRLILLYLDMSLNKTENISVYLADKMNMNYNKISRIFKASSGITVEKYSLKLKVEKAKELLLCGGIPMTEIAWILGYSSSQNFSTVFKKETGKTPLQYHNEAIPHRILRDNMIIEKSNKTGVKSNSKRK